MTSSMVHDFLTIWLPAAATGAAISGLATWLILTARRPKQPCPRIDHPRQRVEVAFFGQEWTGIVNRVDFDAIREEMQIELMSPRALEERYGRRSEAR